MPKPHARFAPARPILPKPMMSNVRPAKQDWAQRRVKLPGSLTLHLIVVTLQFPAQGKYQQHHMIGDLVGAVFGGSADADACVPRCALTVGLTACNIVFQMIFIVRMCQPLTIHQARSA